MNIKSVYDQLTAAIEGEESTPLLILARQAIEELADELAIDLDEEEDDEEEPVTAEELEELRKEWGL